jgi:hypothetical protein
MKLSILLALLLLSFQARASVLLDWATAPQGPITTIVGGPNGTFSTASDFKNVDLVARGTNFGSLDGLSDPRVGKAPYPVPVLSSIADFVPAKSGQATVTFTLDFFGFKQGVKDVSFTLFNVDNDNGVGRGGVPKHLDDVITFRTAGLALTGHADNVVSGNTVTGIAQTGPSTWGGPQAEVNVKSAGNLPLHQIVFKWTETVFGPTQDFQDELAIGNVIFTPVPEVGQLVIGFIAALLGGIWLWLQNRKKIA